MLESSLDSIRFGGDPLNSLSQDVLEETEQKTPLFDV